MENVKTVTSQKCSHCGKEILIEISTPLPVVEAILTPEHVRTAKDAVISMVFNSKMTDQAKKEAIDWVNQEDVIFGENDVVEIAANILNK